MPGDFGDYPPGTSARDLDGPRHEPSRRRLLSGPVDEDVEQGLERNEPVRFEEADIPY